jgi:hypothetical protein
VFESLSRSIGTRLPRFAAFFLLNPVSNETGFFVFTLFVGRDYKSALSMRRYPRGRGFYLFSCRDEFY